MSFKSFLTNLWNQIKDLFNGLAPKAKWAVDFGQTWVERLKTLTDSDVVGAFLKLTGTDVDDKILERLKAELPRIAVNLKLLDEAFVAGLSADEVAAKLAEVVQSIDHDYKKDFYDTLAVRIALVAADGKVSWDELKYTMKWYNDHKKGKLEVIE